MREMCPEQPDVHPIRALLHHQAEEGKGKHDRFAQKLAEMRNRANPIQSLLVEGHVLALFPEDGVCSHYVSVPSLHPPQTLTPHGARIQRYL